MTDNGQSLIARHEIGQKVVVNGGQRAFHRLIPHRGQRNGFGTRGTHVARQSGHCKVGTIAIGTRYHDVGGASIILFTVSTSKFQTSKRSSIE